MRIEFNKTGAERKELVKAIGEILEVKPKYLGMPTAAYAISYFTVSKNGTLEVDDSVEVESLLEQLADRGFTAAHSGKEETTEKVSEENGNAPQSEDVGLTVAIPLDKVSVGNLTNLLEAKGSLIKKALGIDSTAIEMNEESVAFPWFDTCPDADTAKAYTDFIAALCRMSKEQKRINATEKQVDNEKYAFRCFLLRLGFIGAEYKQDRKILLKNLTGSSAFRTAKEADTDEISE